jgi:hypothetical protein
MISTEILYGQGLGNQLACYVALRALAERKGYSYSIYDPKACLGDKRYNNKGLYFMDLDLGEQLDVNSIKHYYNEVEHRYYVNTCYHDKAFGCWVNKTDEQILNIQDGTHLLGVLQGPDYFYPELAKVKEWLTIKPEYDNYDLCSDDICILNVRARLEPEIYLPREYWVNAIHHMLEINPNMNFVVITEDVSSTTRLLPELKDNIFHLGVGGDYVTLKNARYLILSNSSFAIFPALTSETVKKVIAPKYMLRHNVSDGYWSCGYNIYPGFEYMDREGKLFSYEECIEEFNEYDLKNQFYSTKVKEQYSNFPDVAVIKPR